MRKYKEKGERRMESLLILVEMFAAIADDAKPLRVLFGNINPQA